MKDENGNEIADPSNAQGGQPSGDANEVQAGIQKRFDELTAKHYAALAAKDEQINTLVANVQALTQKVVAGETPVAPAAPQDPFAGIDWTDPAQVQRAVVMQNQQTEQRLVGMFTKTFGSIQAQLAGSEVQQVASSMGVQDPAIVARASERIRVWKSNGLDISPKDALVFAAGEAALKGPPQPRDARGQFQTVMTPNTPAAPPVPKPKQALPANFNSLPPDKQADILEAQLGDNEF